jgi:hypothetical protein
MRGPAKKGGNQIQRAGRPVIRADSPPWARRWPFVRPSALDRDTFFGQRARAVPICREMEARLLSLVQLRNNVAECIRLAEAARTSEHKSFFIEMAERWLTLAERAEKVRSR